MDQFKNRTLLYKSQALDKTSECNMQQELRPPSLLAELGHVLVTILGFEDSTDLMRDSLV